MITIAPILFTILFVTMAIAFVGLMQGPLYLTLREGNIIERNDGIGDMRWVITKTTPYDVVAMPTANDYQGSRFPVRITWHELDRYYEKAKP